MNEKRFNLHPEIYRVIGICHIETGVYPSHTKLVKCTHVREWTMESGWGRLGEEEILGHMGTPCRAATVMFFSKELEN